MAKPDSKSKYEASVKFIEHLKKVVPKNLSLVDELADILEISNDSAYRRMRGETALSIDETLALCKHFKISLDVLTNRNGGKVTFGYKSMGFDKIDLEGYLQSIIHDFELVKNANQIHMYFAAEDIPIFHHLEYEHLTPFKFFYWRKSILNDPELEGKKYDASHISKETFVLAKKIVSKYVQMPSTEVWTEESISSTLSQIMYYWDAGLFSTQKDALNVCYDVIAMCEHLQKQAEMSCKFLRDSNHIENENNFNLYSCEVQIGNNSLFVQADKLKISLLSFNTFNSLMTFNLDYCIENERWINNLIKKSVLISSVSEKQRFQFFRRVNKMINEVIEKIEKG